MIQCENLVKIYKNGETETIALQGLDLEVKDREMIAVMGASGSGKSTLLNIIGCLEKPDAGALFIDETDVLRLTANELITFKMERIGFIWQNNARNLIPYLSAIENVLAPMRLLNKPDRNRAKELLDAVGLKDRFQSTLYQLSGGEQQRVAIAVALANNPSILLADEPTGSVDSSTCDTIMDLFRSVNKNMGKTIVIVTHDMHLSSMVDRVVYIRDGRTSSELIRTNSGSHLSQTHREFSLIDKNGRVQIPKNILEQSAIKGKLVTFQLVDGNILICSGQEKDT